MKPDFFARRALLIICVVFFLIPFGMRGAKLSFERMENNVKDWLPDSFEETKELAWFAEHFVGEQSFILLTWQGCSVEDESFQLFVEKLRHEIAPAEDAPDPALEKPLADLTPHEQRQLEKAREIDRARKVGDEHGLFVTGNYHRDWGGLDEKWLRGKDRSWYYITPNGELYRWHGRSNVLGMTGRSIKRLFGGKSVTGELVGTFGRPPSRQNRNDFHDDPRKLTARLLRSVTTGPEALQELSEPGGSMWPIGTQYSDEERHVIARRRALDRLKGSMYGPEPYEDFQWTAGDLPRVVFDETIEAMPAGWQESLASFTRELVETEYKGDRSKLLGASLIAKERHWKAMFEAIGAPAPGLQTCVMVTLSKPGTDDLRRVIGRGLLGKPRGKLIDLAEESGVLAPGKPPVLSMAPAPIVHGKVLRMGGPPVDNVAIDEEGQVTLVRLIGLCALIGIGLAFACFRSVLVTMMVFTVGGVSAVASLAIVYWSGSSVDAILMSMPSLVYVLGLSGAVHIVNYYREAVQENGIEGAPLRALSHGFVPCTLAAFTTSLGLLSLNQSEIGPIRKFGVFSAVGVLATLVLLFTYLPAALEQWSPRIRGRADVESGFRRKIHEFWQSVGGWVINHHWWVTATAAVVLVVGAYGLTRIETSIQLLKLFDEDSKIIRDYYWLEENVGKIVPMELVIRVDKDRQYPTSQQRRELPAEEPTPEQRAAEKYQYSFLERIELVAHVQDAVEDVFGIDGRDVVGRALSAATFTPPILDPLDRNRGPTNTNLEENRDRLMAESYLAVDEVDESELWRITVRLGALNDVDYGWFVSQLKRIVEPVLMAYECRDEVLRSIESDRGMNAEGSSVWNHSRIVVLVAPNPQRTVDEVSTTGPEKTGDGEPVDVGRQLAEMTDEELGVHKIFAKVLDDLLRAKGFQGPVAGRVPKRFLLWHDPVAQPLGENATSEFWAAELAKSDCVVVLRDHPDYRMDFIREHAKNVVDARDHTFDSATGKSAKENGNLLNVTYTGVVPIVYKAQRTLLRSLVDSIGWAFVMIAVVMTILLRNRRRQLLNLSGGLISMIPNVFPVVVIFGAMGLIGYVVDIGTMMTASVAMGVAVDDTIHFLTWFRRGIRQGLDRHAAIKEAFSRVAVAMTQTTLIGGLGLSVFALSTFTPTQWFGIMMFTLLVAALVGDLVLLPAILAGPLGKFLCPKVPPASPDDKAARSSSGEGDVPDVLPLAQKEPIAGIAGKAQAIRMPLEHRDGSH